MSWKIINAILGLASVDEIFCRALLENPLQAVQAKKFALTAEEEEVFKRISAGDLAEFSQMLLAQLKAEEKE
jgi:hypothetical protein